jgi:NADH-quinone oxidoreductase subunit H
MDGGIPAQLIVSLAVIVAVIHVILLTVAYLIYVERKLSAYIQDRIGPNRVGPLGLLQPIADGLKFLLKEDYTPPSADRALFTLAPMAIIIPALIGFVVIPWGGVWIAPDFHLPILGHVAGGPVVVAGADVNVGVIYILAVGSLGVYGVTLGGWASNSKFSFLGGLRATAQMLAYEIPLGLALLAALLVAGSFSMFVALLAESNRLPFDNAEAESELVGGYHTEYSSMRFALFFLAEYAHMITGAALFTLLFLGGWQPLPFVPLLAAESSSLLAVLLKFGVFFGKVVTIVCLQVVVRWTLPRLRYDQVMMLGWLALIPLGLALVVMTSLMVFLEWTAWYQLLLANAALAAVVLALQPVLPRHDPNRRVPLYGSRFSPAGASSAPSRG